MNKEECRIFVKKAVDALNEKKAIDVHVIDIGGISSLADYFIIAGASNKNQIEALMDNVEEVLEKDGLTPKHIEGRGSEEWILLDYIDFVIHIFSAESREFYDIERIWSDGISVDMSEDGASENAENAGDTEED